MRWEKTILHIYFHLCRGICTHFRAVNVPFKSILQENKSLDTSFKTKDENYIENVFKNRNILQNEAMYGGSHLLIQEFGQCGLHK